MTKQNTQNNNQETGMRPIHPSLSSKTRHHFRLHNKQLNQLSFSKTPKLNRIIADEYDQAFQAPSIATISFQNPIQKRLSKTLYDPHSNKKEFLALSTRYTQKDKSRLIKDRLRISKIQPIIDNPQMLPHQKPHTTRYMRSRYSELLSAITEDRSPNKSPSPSIEFDTKYQQKKTQNHLTFTAKESFKRQLQTIKVDINTKKQKPKRKHLSLSQQFRSCLPNNNALSPRSNQKKNSFQESFKNKHKLILKYWKIGKDFDVPALAQNSIGSKEKIKRGSLLHFDNDQQYQIFGQQIFIEQYHKVQIK